ncbi:MAG TPA: response regulator transcription factor [Rubrobacter sp.]|jgi:ATP/maltotriose-dependent transcriptional regulator MalT
MPDRIERHRAQEPSDGYGLNPASRQDSPASQPISVLNWRLVAWGGLIGVLAIAASSFTSLWWFLLIFGLLVPVVSALQARWSAERNVGPESPQPDREGELLGALGELGELTATTAAMRTTLTVEEAAGMLEKLAKKGHLQATTQGAVMLYGLWASDRHEPDPKLDPASRSPIGDETPISSRPGGRKERAASATPLVEPLTEREAEVFELLASGRTNREIAADLYVTVGTIKAHTSNIYAKLQARNRAEALARARELGMLA